MNGMYTNSLQAMEHKLNQTLAVKYISEMEKHNQNVERLDFLSEFVRIQQDFTKTTLCDYCEKPIGLSGFQYDPVKESIVHSYHLETQPQK